MGNYIMRILIPVIGGGLFYALWLLVAIPMFRVGSTSGGTLLIIIAPVVTAIGFTIGTLVVESIAKHGSRGLFHAWIWPQVGCIVGAAVVYPFGPMLIVFGMFVLGTFAVALREFRSLRRGAPAN